MVAARAFEHTNAKQLVCLFVRSFVRWHAVGAIFFSAYFENLNENSINAASTQLQANKSFKEAKANLFV